MGRPTKKTPELLAEICERIATSDCGLHFICKEERMPGITTVMRWLDEDESFRAQYARAKELQADYMAEQILDISDDSSKDTVHHEKFGDMPDNEWINRSKLRVESRKWLMGKMAPKKYGDKMEIDHNISDTRKAASELFPDALDEAGKGE